MSAASGPICARDTRMITSKASGLPPRADTISGVRPVLRYLGPGAPAVCGMIRRQTACLLRPSLYPLVYQLTLQPVAMERAGATLSLSLGPLPRAVPQPSTRSLTDRA
eukprot:scaffold227838_cov39-Tisochrysis_lutea.AAC.1